MNHPNAEIITHFYEALARLDGANLGTFYHPEATFSDEVFVNLNAVETAAMWQMLCSRAKDFTLTFSGVEADDEHGKAHWEAVYTFTTTGRRVHNVIDATFAFRDGKIWRHCDEFDFAAWSQQALGPIVLLLGWTGIIQYNVRNNARKRLMSYMAKHAAQQPEQKL
jgi:ketosteroid isomerase-like protein